eukprot:GHVN01061797.1.p1 GENE.GHVN01061797.1~~GHVN01061797.1.p1  ORF type:complete len:329 (+),score=75.06 GHVN01061797.1:41-1027(+)
MIVDHNLPITSSGRQSIKTSLPFVGYGTWQMGDEVSKMVEEAITLGYRHIDCAACYGNEKQVGIGIKAALDKGVCKRSDLFITSKLWNTFHSPHHVRLGFNRSLTDLGLEYLDLYLMHFPIGLKFVPFEKEYPADWHNPDSGEIELDTTPVIDTWKAMEQLVKDGLVCHIGVSNFGIALLRDLINSSTIKPVVNQIECHPYLNQTRMLTFCKQHGIALVAYSPLGSGAYKNFGIGVSEADSPLLEKNVGEIGKKHSKSSAQVILRWALQRGVVVIPKCSTQERAKENFSLFDFTLSEDEMNKIDALNKNKRFNDPSVFFGDKAPLWDV